MKKNKYITFTEPGKAVLREAEESAPQDTKGMIFIRNLLSLVSPGTELAFFEGTHSDLKAGIRKYPTASGYSSVGRVERTGSGVNDIKPGDLVMAMCGHCESAWVRTYDKVPDGLTPEKAVFAILGAIALHGVREANLIFGQNVLVSGLGAIGQLAARLCRITPIDKLVTADVYPFRLEMAKAAGADYYLNAGESDFSKHVMDITGGRGFDVIIEASGNPQALVGSLEYAAMRGKIIVLGCPHGEVGIDFYRNLQKKELSITGSYQPNCPEMETPYYPWSKKRNRELVMGYQLRNKLDFSPLITHRGQPEMAQEFYDILSKEKNRCITAVFEWNPEK